MKVGILTHYDVNNQGAQLQMLALYRQLEKMGHVPVVLTYTKNFDFQRSERLRNQISVRSIPYIFKEFVLKKGLRLTWHNTKKYKVNKKFRQHTLRFEDYASSDVDVAAVGSDQVFSIPVGINMMMFGFGMRTNQIISYAPSFAQTDIRELDEHHCRPLVAAGLQTFTALSVRDIHSQEMVRTLIQREVPIVCDPALLYDFSEDRIAVRKPKKPYLLVYSYDRRMVEPDEVDAIRRYAKAHGLITVSAGTFHKWCDKNIVCNCLEWIEYFRYAEAIITDTFHGTIASIIARRPFTVCVRETNQNKLADLLRVTCTEDRRIQDITYEEVEAVLGTAMEWTSVDSALTQLRSNSMEYLQQALDKCVNRG